MINLNADNAIRIGNFAVGEVVIAELQDDCGNYVAVSYTADECGKV